MCELEQGRKLTHWMWYIFPQLQGLGLSSTAKFYALQSADEARAYLEHPILGNRLIHCTAILLRINHSSANAIFGYPDDLKFHSCLTLFNQVSDDPIFQHALDCYFQGQGDPKTLALLKLESQ